MYCFTITLAALIASAAAQAYVLPNQKEDDIMYQYLKRGLLPRTVTWNKQVGKGNVFGTLGNDGTSLFGKGGYKQDIFNDNRGKLTGEAYGSRVLGPNGDSSHLGGRLDWANKNANAAVDVSKQIGGSTSVQATGSGVWKIDKNTDVSGGAMLRQENLGHGRPDIGVQAQFEHRM